MLGLKGRRLAVRPLLTGAICALVFTGSCVSESPTGPSGDEAFLAIITKTDGPAEISAGDTWTLRVKRLDFDQSLDTAITVTPGDTIILRLPLDSYDLVLDGVPIACKDQAGLARRRFLGAADATYVVRFNVFCNTFLAMNVATVGARDAAIDQDYVYRLMDQHGAEVRLGVVNPIDTVLFDDIQPGTYSLELSHIESNCMVVSDGGRRHSFVIDPPRVAVIRYQIECSNDAERPRIVHFESSYRDGQSVFYMEAVDVDPDGSGLRMPDIDAYYWSITDCARRELTGTRPRRGLAQYGAATLGADTVRLTVVVPVGLPDADMVGKCTSIRVTDLGGNSSAFVEERIGDETGFGPFDLGSIARLDAGGQRLEFQVQASDPDGDFAGSFQRFAFRDGTFGDPDGAPDVISRNAFGYDVFSASPPFSFVDYFFSLDDLLSVQTILVDRQANHSQIQDSDFSR
jgi:hypothetical protein